VNLSHQLNLYEFHLLT